jgi:CsoR family transcriptional regulator, copper-sensing transcriptional repressor
MIWRKIMDDITKTAVTRRLASAAGHLKGIERMVAEDTYCIDVIRQIQAVQAALNKVSTIMLDNHLRTCITTAIQGDDVSEREKMLEEVTSVFEVSGKL